MWSERKQDAGCRDWGKRKYQTDAQLRLCVSSLRKISSWEGPKREARGGAVGVGQQKRVQGFSAKWGHVDYCLSGRIFGLRLSLSLGSVSLSPRFSHASCFPHLPIARGCCSCICICCDCCMNELSGSALRDFTLVHMENILAAMLVFRSFVWFPPLFLDNWLLAALLFWRLSCSVDSLIDFVAVRLDWQIPGLQVGSSISLSQWKWCQRQARVIRHSHTHAHTLSISRTAAHQ